MYMHMYKLIQNHPDFLLISKNPGVDFHKGENALGLVQKIREDHGITELYPLHRLDCMTSGLLLFAKNHDCAQQLALQFRNHSIDKFYIALGGNHPHKKQGTVIGDMKKIRNGKWQICHTKENPAITQFFSSGLGNGLRLFLLRILTGKTHQIRVALRAVSAPIFGDHLYNNKSDVNMIPDRGYLHAYAIGFKLNGSYFSFIDKPDSGTYFCSESFQNALIKYADPWKLHWPKIVQR